MYISEDPFLFTAITYLTQIRVMNLHVQYTSQVTSQTSVSVLLLVPGLVIELCQYICYTCKCKSHARTSHAHTHLYTSKFYIGMLNHRLKVTHCTHNWSNTQHSAYWTTTYYQVYTFIFSIYKYMYIFSCSRKRQLHVYLWLVVFEPVGLINDQYFPGYGLKDGWVNADELIGGQ